MQLARKYLQTLLMMIFVTSYSLAAEQASRNPEIDRLHEAYSRKFPTSETSIEAQLDQLDPLFQEAKTAGRPIYVVFGAIGMEGFHFKLPEKNPFVIWLLDYVVPIPHTSEELLQNKSGMENLRNAYNATKPNKQYDDLTDDELIDFCIKLINDPCVISGNVFDPNLYKGLSSRYSGAVRLVTTDYGVTEKKDFSAETLQHYMQLLEKTTGVMAFDVCHFWSDFEDDVLEAYVEIKNIKTSEGYHEEELKEFKGKSFTSLSDEEWAKFKAIEKELLAKRRPFDMHDEAFFTSFKQAVLNKIRTKYANQFENGASLPTPQSSMILEIRESTWKYYDLFLEEDQEEYKLLWRTVFNSSLFDDWKREIANSHSQILKEFTSQPAFSEYDVTSVRGIFPYWAEREGAWFTSEPSGYVLIKRR
ncbi:MAG: hypothetical protein K2W94_03815 [Alphaproteobacteria bacterium]|nr:hypothetical protein [Alphaproteobacteria bacterium]